MDIHTAGNSAPEKGRKKSGTLKTLLAAAGLFLAGWLIWRLGPEQVWRELSGGWWPGFLLVAGAYVLQQSLGTFALWLLGTKPRAPGWSSTPFWRLARVRYIGEVLNYSMPTGGVGGEPFKLIVLGRAEGKNTAFRALAAAKFLHVAAVGPFAATVFFSAALTDVTPARWHGGFVYAGAVMLVITAALWSMVLWSPVGRTLLGGYYRIRHRVPRRLRSLRIFLHMDLAAAREIRRAPGRTGAAYACYLGMWLAASLEWFAIAHVLGGGVQGLSLTGAGIFECATILVAGLIPVPAGVGTQEAGRAAVAAMLGLPPHAGIAMSLIRRGREIIMVITGALLGLVEWRRRGA